MNSKPIYVEISIHTEMEKLWEATQSPEMHEQWDLRFTSITYLPKKEGDPQLFSYKTKIGFGLEIEGWGKSVGSRLAEDGSRTSSLHFGTDQALSIIREGKGYWKYKPEADSITFLTQYDYEPQFGRAGRWFDQLIFRPLIGWGTALSFDVLKRWLEKHESPVSQYRQFIMHWMITFLFFFVWAYHGLVPKIIGSHPEEMAMVQNSLSLSPVHAFWLVMIIGIGEVLFAFLWIIYKNRRHLFVLQMILFPLLTLSAVTADFRYFVQPFNPLTFNLSLWVLSIVGYLVSKDVPTARNCKRKR